MHKEIVNGGVDLVPNLNRYCCHYDPAGSVTLPKIFVYAYNKFQAYLKAVELFKEEFGIQASMDQIPNIEIVEAPGDTK